MSTKTASRVRLRPGDPEMLLHYLTNRHARLGLTALLASFMSGMAGNVTAFNTVWTYDIYQATSARVRAIGIISGSAA